MEIATSFYQENAEAFSDTRFCLWDVVRDFGKQFGPTDYVLDAGCGNGKNIKYFQNMTKIVGFDKSEPLLEICKKKGYDVFHSDILDIPLEDELFHYIICIAVIHHLDSPKKHISAIHELMRLLKPNGQLLVTLWAFESDDYSKKKNFQKGGNIVKFNHAELYYNIYDKMMVKELLDKLNYKSHYYWERGNWNLIFTKSSEE